MRRLTLAAFCFWFALHSARSDAQDHALSFAETVASAATEIELSGPVLVGHEAPAAKGATATAANRAAPISAPAATPVRLPPIGAPSGVASPVVTDVIMLIDATHSMAWPSGRERRMAIAQWSALDIADGVPENIPAAFVALHDEATALRQLLPLTSDGRGHLRRTVMRLVPAGEGKIDKLLVEARRLLANKPDAVPLIVLATRQTLAAV